MVLSTSASKHQSKQYHLALDANDLSSRALQKWQEAVLMTLVPYRNLLQLLLVVDQDIGRHARKLGILENRE
jgi:hypothetical protein